MHQFHPLNLSAQIMDIRNRKRHWPEQFRATFLHITPSATALLWRETLLLSFEGLGARTTELEVGHFRSLPLIFFLWYSWFLSIIFSEFACSYSQPFTPEAQPAVFCQDQSMDEAHTIILNMFDLLNVLECLLGLGSAPNLWAHPYLLQHPGWSDGWDNLSDRVEVHFLEVTTVFSSQNWWVR